MIQGDLEFARARTCSAQQRRLPLDEAAAENVALSR